MSRSRIVLTGVADVLVAAVAALLAFRLLGAWSGNDSNPPRCFNAAGGEVSCDLTQTVVMLPTFVVVLLVLVGWQVLRAWRRGGPNSPLQR